MVFFDCSSRVFAQKITDHGLHRQPSREVPQGVTCTAGKTQANTTAQGRALEHFRSVGTQRQLESLRPFTHPFGDRPKIRSHPGSKARPSGSPTPRPDGVGPMIGSAPHRLSYLRRHGFLAKGSAAESRPLRRGILAAETTKEPGVTRHTGFDSTKSARNAFGFPGPRHCRSCLSSDGILRKRAPKRLTRWRLAFQLALLAIIGGHSSTALALPVLHLSDPQAEVTFGSQISLEILASGIPAGSDGKGLFGFGFQLGFNPDVLSVSSFTLGPLWTNTGFNGSQTGPGTIGMTANRFFQNSGPQGNNILLATVTFTGLLAADFIDPVTGSFICCPESALPLTHFSGPGDNVLFDGTRLDAIEHNFFSNGFIRVIPEPSTALLLACGLAGLAVAKR